MKQHRKLNRRGKITASLILIPLFILPVMLIGMNSKEATGQEKPSISSIQAEELQVFNGEKQTLESSELYRSIEVKKENDRKHAQAQKEEKQHDEDQQEKAIYLTFDDGPSSETNRLLNLLDQNHAKATFFMLGPNIRKHPKAVNRMVDEGFSVGMHGMTHSVQQIYGSTTAPLNEMKEDQSIIEELTGVTSNLVRVPYGSVPYLTGAMRELLHQNDFKIWDWNVDSRDWELKDERFVQESIQKIEDLEESNITPIVLLHDKLATIKHLPKLLTYLQQNGYETKTITNEKVPLTFSCAGRCHSIN
ncbi:polysaccharide deacetylase family protein [Guptibacillus hwajinpoensis]|uniref:polysaccharide deacetylase family protein n=1 Tax=Guptibacillus hwajinpoensis TaxID=208199 RepID=UPI00384E34BE